VNALIKSGALAADFDCSRVGAWQRSGVKLDDIPFAVRDPIWVLGRPQCPGRQYGIPVDESPIIDLILDLHVSDGQSKCKLKNKIYYKNEIN